MAAENDHVGSVSAQRIAVFGGVFYFGSEIEILDILTEGFAHGSAGGDAEKSDLQHTKIFDDVRLGEMRPMTISRVENVGRNRGEFGLFH